MEEGKDEFRPGIRDEDMLVKLRMVNPYKSVRLEGWLR
jgi:hypothetical protein